MEEGLLGRRSRRESGETSFLAINYHTAGEWNGFFEVVTIGVGGCTCKSV